MELESYPFVSLLKFGNFVIFKNIYIEASMKNSYWNNNGKYQREYNELKFLVPRMGKATTVAGELLRSVNRLYYDFYNNGMCNNTTGAINFLLEKRIIDQEIHNLVYQYAKEDAVYDGFYKNDPLQISMEEIVNKTIEFILKNPSSLSEVNSEDLFDYTDFCTEDELESCVL